MENLGKSNTTLSAAMNARTLGSGGGTLVLAHGYGADQSVWDKIVPHLASSNKVVLFDWSFSGAVKDPNHFDPSKYYSSYEAFADDLISLLEEMKLESVVYVGHSMAGMIGCIASIKRPQLFKSLILVGASPRYINSEDYEGGFEAHQIEQLLLTMETDFQTWASNFASLAVDAKDPPSVEKFEKCLKRVRPEFAAPVAKIVFLSDHRDVLAKITTPCTIVHTTNDIVSPVSVASYMQRNIASESSVELIEADGHFPQLTAHVELLQVLSRVLGFDVLVSDQVDEVGHPPVHSGAPVAAVSQNH